MQDFKVELSINQNIIDKNISGNKRFFSEGWSAQESTLQELADNINLGYLRGLGPE